MLALVLLHGALGTLVLLWLSAPGSLNMLWLPSGVALAAVLLGGRRYLWAVFFGSILAILATGMPLLLLCVFALGNTLETALAHWWLSKNKRFSRKFRSKEDLFQLLLAALLGCGVSALVGGVSLWLTGFVRTEMVFAHVLQWWQSEVLGIMLITPLILIWRQRPAFAAWTLKAGLEVALCLGMAFFCGQIVFLGWWPAIFGAIAKAYWVFPFVAWAAVRTNRHVIALMLLITAVQALYSAVHGIGVFADDFSTAGLGNFWFFVALLTGIGYSLALLVFELRGAVSWIESERQFVEDIIDSLPGAFFMINDEMRLIHWNSFLQANSLYSSEELVSKHALDLVHAEDRPRVMEQFGIVLAEGVAQIEARMVDKLGDVKPYQVNARRTLIDGRIYIVGMAENILARKQAEEQLRASEFKYRQLFDNTQTRLIILDGDGTIHMINQTNALALGGRPEDFVGRSVRDLDPENADHYIEQYRKILQTGEGQVYDNLFSLGADPRWFHSRLQPLLNMAGKPEFVLVSVFDITERKEMEEELRTSEFRYRQLFDNTNTQITIIDGDGVIQMVNASNARMLGGSPEDFVGRSLYEMDPEHAAAHVLRYRQILQSGQGMITEDVFPLADGPHWFHSHLQPLYDSDGKPEYVLVSAFDITERKRIEEELRRSEELWKFALEGTGDSVWDWEIATDTVKLSPRWKGQLGYAEDEEAGEWFDHLHPEDVSIAQTNSRVLRDGSESVTSIELRMRGKDGKYRWILARGMVATRDADGRPLRVVGTNSDITALKEHQQQLEHVAHFDVLTGLPNRLLLSFRLHQAMAQSQRRMQSLAVAYLDLDGFKAVNDRHGHNVGDELLVQVAQRMKAALREGDTLARIGGDEFIAVLTDLDRHQDCARALERLLQAAAAPVLVNGHTLRVSASIGATIYPDDDGDAEQLIRHADQAMYQAKQTGKNRYHLFDIEHDAAVQLQHESIANIRRGLANDEFVLFFQPKVNMRSGSLIGVEALIRWQHPELGLLMPEKFLPVIEEQLVSIELGEWVLDQALQQMSAWLAIGLDLPVSVNISAYHLQQAGFFGRLAALLAAYPDVPPANLQLEILETSAFEDVMHVSNVMRDCQSLGIDFAIDDFGTGYSSLTYLKRLPAAMLKIDRSFVLDMLEDPDDLAIVEGITGLAKAFRRKVIAEGVETLEHGELLLQLGCELAQGYGIAQPMTAMALFTWAATWQPDARWARWGDVSADHRRLDLLFAKVRHRQWIRSIDHLLDGEGHVSSVTDLESCHFETWLCGADAAGNEDFQKALEIHEHMHALGVKMVAFHAAGQYDEARARQPELHALYDALDEQLQKLLKTTAVAD
ncbi:MAG: EAL domain-containing protein [Sterolibacterium sp.]|nr:EAL domain-containing protein [Sterolibacterium sp.]